MTPFQFQQIYQHLIDDSEEIKNHKIFNLNEFKGALIDPIKAILYLPLYSTGMAAIGMKPRIEYLINKSKGDDVNFYVTSSLETLESICEELIAPNRKFGDFFIRLYEIRKRAKLLNEIGVDEVRSILGYSGSFPSFEEFSKAFRLLCNFPGVSDKAAQHILMDLGWPIIKPDRHIQRVLYRLGGWSDYFNNEDGNAKLTSKKSYEFQKKWFDTVRNVNNFDGYSDSNATAGAQEYPPLSTITSRQIDVSLMWFSQNREADNSGLGMPRCSFEPQCDKCLVPNCQRRRSIQ